MQEFTTNNRPVINDFRECPVEPGTINTFWLRVVSDGFGSPICIPLMVARGVKDGPTLGLTAAVHGNELNGIPVIHRLFKEINVEELNGTIIGIPVVNVPSYMRMQRRIIDGVDLNHIMPGKANGNASEFYAHRFVNRLVKHFDILLDLHTASFGRINSYYIRADMDHPVTQKLAFLQNAEIIVHNPPSDGTLRGAADELGIPAITLEVGNPSVFQKKLIKSGVEGIHNTLCYLDMIDDDIITSPVDTILCKRSYWLYTDKGGLLTTSVNLLDQLESGQKIAAIYDVFGDKLKEYATPEAGVVVGKSVSPVNQSGGRILHLGIL